MLIGSIITLTGMIALYMVARILNDLFRSGLWRESPLMFIIIAFWITDAALVPLGIGLGIVLNLKF
jgi:hypothetical protein